MRKPLVVVLLLLAAGCSRRGKGDPNIVAEAGDVRVTRADLDARAASRLLSLRNQEYEAKHEILNEMLFERLVKKEAESQRVSEDKFIESRLKLDREPPDPRQVDAIYKANLAAFGKRSEADAKAEIVRLIREDQKAQARRAFRRDLLKSSHAKVNLDPPRVDLKIPPGTPFLGPANAPVTLVEFADYQCPFCQSAEAAVETVLDKNPKTVRFMLRDFPLDMKHPRSVAAAAAAHCAGDQGKFFEYRHSLLALPGSFDQDDLLERARTLQLKTDGFRACLVSGQHEKEVKDSFTEAQALGVNATPTFFMNGRVLEGVRSPEQLQDLLDTELQGI